MPTTKFPYNGKSYTIDDSGDIRDAGGNFLTGADAVDSQLLQAGKNAANDPTMTRITELEDQRTQLLTITTSPTASALQKQAAQAEIAKLEPQLSSAYRDAA